MKTDIVMTGFPAETKDFLLVDKNGNFGILQVTQLPIRVVEYAAGAKCLKTGKIIKRRKGVVFPEDITGIEKVNLARIGLRVCGAKGQEFDATGRV